MVDAIQHLRMFTGLLGKAKKKNFLNINIQIIEKHSFLLYEEMHRIVVIWNIK